MAADLAKEYPKGVYIAAFENHRGKAAYEQIVKLLDTNHDGQLSAEEKRRARIILYGHSWGASEAITVARKLGRDDIPVLLTIQVDSVAKKGQDDALIPANVAQAVNFYQLDGYLKGRADNSRRRPLAHPDHRKFPIPLQIKPSRLQKISLVGPSLSQSSHSNRMRSRRVG